MILSAKVFITYYKYFFGTEYILTKVNINTQTIGYFIENLIPKNPLIPWLGA